jgi:hypothetical protein
LPLPEWIKKESPGLFPALSCLDRVGIAPIEFLDAVCHETEVAPIHRLHVFERPMEALEDRECVD